MSGVQRTNDPLESVSAFHVDPELAALAKRTVVGLMLDRARGELDGAHALRRLDWLLSHAPDPPTAGAQPQRPSEAA